MPDGFDMTIHLNTERGEVVVEQQKAGGVTTHKHIILIPNKKYKSSRSVV